MQIHQNLGVSPLQLLFGNAVDIDRNLFNNTTSTQNQDTIRNMNDLRYRTWFNSIMSRQQTLMEVAMKT